MIVPLSPNVVGEKTWTCTIASGTSMSAALVAGAMAVLKSIHPDWSSAALISSVLTTVDPIEIRDDEDILGVGSGLINAKKAQEPGLVYDMNPIDYIRYLRGRKLDLSELVQTSPHFTTAIKESNNENIHPRDLNLANLSAAFLENERGYMFKRRLTNVGIPNSVYSCYVERVEGLDIRPRPLELTFVKTGEVQEYEVDVQVVDWSKGGKYGFRTYIEWRYGKYRVRSYIFILKSWLFEPKPKTSSP
ncbi:hypothetical protein KSS87_018099 [Heliosperma pusillum]|nr:hypothetical protein KSS87_018099 [Heliosperma pusillum]